MYTQLKTYSHHLHKTFIVLTHTNHLLQYTVMALDRIDIAQYSFMKRYSFQLPRWFFFLTVMICNSFFTQQLKLISILTPTHSIPNNLKLSGFFRLVRFSLILNTQMTTCKKKQYCSFFCSDWFVRQFLQTFLLSFFYP